MGKVSQAEHHVDLLQKEALGNLQLRMDEVGISVSGLSITGYPGQHSTHFVLQSCNKGCNDRVSDWWTVVKNGKDVALLIVVYLSKHFFFSISILRKQCSSCLL